MCAIVSTNGFMRAHSGTEATLEMMDLFHGRLRGIEHTSMDVFNDSPDVSFELHDQIVKIIIRSTAEQGFNLGARSSDHTVTWKF